MNCQPGHFDIYIKHCFLNQLLEFYSYFNQIFYIHLVYVYKCFENIQWRKSAIYMFRENALNMAC